MFGFVSVAFASEAVTGFAWSDDLGWINFGYTNGNVQISDTELTGYAWSSSAGRINLSPTQSGVTNNMQGTLSGYAWSENTGWINFQGVWISPLGRFRGTATGDNGISINFSCANCNVSTNWKPQSVGGGGGFSYVSWPSYIIPTPPLPIETPPPPQTTSVSTTTPQTTTKPPAVSKPTSPKKTQIQQPTKPTSKVLQAPAQTKQNKSFIKKIFEKLFTGFTSLFRGKINK